MARFFATAGRKTLAAARHLAAFVFGAAVVVSAFPPADQLSADLGARAITVSFDTRRLVATSTARAAGEGATAPNCHPVTLRFLPAGVVVEHAEGDAASYLRVDLPAAVIVGATGLAWLGLLIASGRLEGSPRAMGARPVGRPRKASLLQSWVWGARYALGGAVVAAAWLCVYTLPRDAGGDLFTEWQALHVAGASFGVCVATMLIAFD